VSVPKEVRDERKETDVAQAKTQPLTSINCASLDTGDLPIFSNCVPANDRSRRGVHSSICCSMRVRVSMKDGRRQETGRSRVEMVRRTLISREKFTFTV
jgi:hypothetical protein